MLVRLVSKYVGARGTYRSAWERFFLVLAQQLFHGITGRALLVVLVGAIISAGGAHGKIISATVTKDGYGTKESPINYLCFDIKTDCGKYKTVLVEKLILDKGKWKRETTWSSVTDENGRCQFSVYWGVSDGTADKKAIYIVLNPSRSIPKDEYTRWEAEGCGGEGTKTVGPTKLSALRKRDTSRCPWEEKRSTNGGDPPIWGKIMAFPTPERHMGQDLNGDGDKNDTVLRYMNIETGEVVNTGAIVSGLPRAISIYDDVIAFVGERGMIRYYRISTGEIKDVGMKGNTPSLHGNILVFRSSEQIAFFDLASATFLDINIQGSSPTIYGDLLAFEWGGTVRYHDLMSKKTVDTKELGSSPFIWGDIIAFVADERTRGQDLNADGDQHDAIISYYRISTGETVYTGVSGSLPWVYGNVIVFCAYEWAGGKDLNADGKTLGSVIQYYDISTGEVVNTGILGAEPSIYQETITYYVWESWVGCDLTGDGDVSDPVVGFFRIGDGVWARKGADKE